VSANPNLGLNYDRNIKPYTEDPDNTKAVNTS
jgi:hypothetical protein